MKFSPLFSSRYLLTEGVNAEIWCKISDSFYFDEMHDKNMIGLCIQSIQAHN